MARSSPFMVAKSRGYASNRGSLIEHDASRRTKSLTAIPRQCRHGDDMNSSGHARSKLLARGYFRAYSYHPIERIDPSRDAICFTPRAFRTNSFFRDDIKCGKWSISSRIRGEQIRGKVDSDPYTRLGIRETLLVFPDNFVCDFSPLGSCVFYGSLRSESTSPP